MGTTSDFINSRWGNGTTGKACLSYLEADYRLFCELIFFTIAADTHAAGRVKTVLMRHCRDLFASPPRKLMIGLSPRKIDYTTLCKTIENRLCQLGHLESNQFPMTQREVIRGGKSVGVYFCLHGPRSVKLTAICDFYKNTVIFYGSDGIRRESMSIALAQPVA